jgi:hypothetical protein
MAVFLCNDLPVSPTLRHQRRSEEG